MREMLKRRILWLCFCLFFSCLSLWGQGAQEKKEHSYASLGFFFLPDKEHADKRNLIGAASIETLDSFPMSAYFQDYVDTFAYNKKLERSLSQTAYTLLVFGGIWWCPDTRAILSKLIFYLKRTRFDTDRVGIVGADREKKTIGHLHTLFGITNVPTIIVLRDGKEKGRIVEYGKTGDWEEELARLLK